MLSFALKQQHTFKALLLSPPLLPFSPSSVLCHVSRPLCCRICRRRICRRRLKSTEGFEGGSGSRQTEGGVDGSLGSFLLQRYLQDQLLLVIDEASIITREDDEGIGKFDT